jgi:flagellar hook-length control protein FliK
MASVPNMQIALTPAVPGTAAPAEGESDDVFAGLLSIVPPGEPILGDLGEAQAAAAPVLEARIRPVTAEISAPIDPEALQRGEAEADEQAVAISDPNEGERDDAGKPVFTPAVDFIPILQAQNSYAVTATTLAVPAVASSVAGQDQPEGAVFSTTIGVTSVEAETDIPETASRQVPPAQSPTGRRGDMSDGDTPELTTPVKAALKAALAHAKSPQAKETPPPVTPPQAEERGGIGKVRPLPTAGSAATVSVPVPAQPVQASAAPAAPAAAAEPAMQPAPMDRAASPMPRPAERMIGNELDLAHESEWLEQLARDIARTGSGEGPMRFRLHPQTLGQLRVELTQGDQGTAVRLTVETEAARAILSDAQPRLMQEARAQGVRIAHAEVDLAGTGHQASGDPRRQEDGRQNVFIRTARGAGADAAQAAEPGRASSDRYA